MEDQKEGLRINKKENLLENRSFIELLKFGIKKFNKEVFLANPQNLDINVPNTNIDSVLDNLEFLEDSITNLDEFSDFIIKDELKKGDFYYMSICPKDKLIKKNKLQLKDIKKIVTKSDLKEPFTSYRILKTVEKTFNFFK